MSDQSITPEHPLLPHRDFLRRLALALASDETRAADLQQDVWLAALRRPSREIAHLRSLHGPIDVRAGEATTVIIDLVPR